MAELSSNWKQLQAKLKAQSTSSSSTRSNLKRKNLEPTQQSTKKPKVHSVSTSHKVTKPSAKKTQSKPMGAAQSRPVEEAQQHGRSPSLSVWAADNGISAEALAEAYKLGSRDTSMLAMSKDDKVNAGLTGGMEIGKYIAIDCEMVGVGPGGYESVLARVSMVDFHGRQIYDSYVKPQEAVTDWRTAVSGISKKEMRFARDFRQVQREVAKVLDGRILIGHDIKHDLDALMLSHPVKDIRDTSKHHNFKKHGNGRKPALRVLAQLLLNTEIQSGSHSSVEDARVTMLLFRKHKSEFDVDHANRYGSPKPTSGNKSKTKKKK